MEIIGVEHRIQTDVGPFDDIERLGKVVVVQPSDDGNNGGHFIGVTDKFRGNDAMQAWGQELWIANVDPELLDELEANPTSPNTSRLASVYFPGKIVLGPKSDLYMAPQRGEISQPAAPLHTNSILENGPSVEIAIIEAYKNGDTLPIRHKNDFLYDCYGR